MRRNLTRAERLKRKADFDRVFQRGKRVKGDGSKLIVLENGLERTRYAVSPAKKYGSSVERNRAKRICREVCRNNKHRLSAGYDVVMVIYPGSDTFAERQEQFLILAERASILASQSTFPRN